MGVTGLWTVLQPCARPIKIETLNKKRLAVDASIWIYQFLKAVRDKEGNALRNSHIVGFFRRICKLLFFGIKPVFVFDGGAPALKRQTISNRKRRREGRRDDAVRTAGKLLALQMQRVAEEEERKRKEARRRPREEPEEEIPDNVVYAEEVLQTQQERQQNRKFKKKDAYHLPELDTSLSAMGQPNDPRIMSLEELEEYARQFDRGEDINVYDFSKIDFDSPFFTSLPASDRYNILNAARLRSRLRMGYSKDQLDNMFPNRMEFSKFQIERVRERNDLTQRLMNINGMADDMFGVNGTSRIASEKGREYVLVKNDGVEGGWALGVVTNKEEGQITKPIDVDTLPTGAPGDDENWESEDEFEDVPIEGLNRLPKLKPSTIAPETEARNVISEELAKRRRAFYASRNGQAANPKLSKLTTSNQDPDSLFLAEDDNEEEWENVDIGGSDALFMEPQANEVDEEEAQLQKAIALSLQQDYHDSSLGAADTEEDEYREVFQQQRVQESVPFATVKGSGLAIGRMANQRSSKVAVSRGPFQDSDSDEDDMDLRAAMAQSRKTKASVTTNVPTSKVVRPPKPAPAKPILAPGFDGPLPFEKLNLGHSILGKKKMDKIEEASAGGFVRDLGKEEKPKSATPLPPWFIGNTGIQQENKAQEPAEFSEQQRQKDPENNFQFQELQSIRKQSPHEVIDLEAPQNQPTSKAEVATIESSEDEDMEMEDVIIEEPKLRMGDLADKVQADPPKPLSDTQRPPPHQEVPTPKSPQRQEQRASKSPSFHPLDDEPVEWSESEPENLIPSTHNAPVPEKEQTPQHSKSASPGFVYVPIESQPPAPRAPRARRPRSPAILEGAEDLSTAPVPLSGTANEAVSLDLPDEDSDQYSDPEDAELFASLAQEAEEHARFASSLNSSAGPINFDEELKQLRAQQKKDRRDADEVTQTMISECQHLLTLFGLPYITAPMEAEAQCAQLVNLGLVDGIVTDDSDTFLFGGTRVYKNMFNAAKFVECYLSSDLNTEFSLTREKLIAIAQLLGSDYTTGIPGIGPVTALEILSEFGDLNEFKDWWTEVQAHPPTTKQPQEQSQFRRRFRRTQAAKLFLPPSFPDPRVAEAYLHPEVDSDPHPFVWGVPDLDALRSFLSSQIGWSAERTDEVLVPVIKDMNRREKEGTQSNITRFFEGGVGAGTFAPRVMGKKGKRLGVALGRLKEMEKGRDGEGDGEAEAETETESKGDTGAEGETDRSRTARTGRAKRKKKVSRKDDVVQDDEVAFQEAVDNDDEDDDVYTEPRKKARRTKKR
ncbi:PIN domain-like protein [Delitschia confertaspora ATCC 74209]|uniref:PIN domain-like protein n=1 Tax=Delitschia confertaspora ATCC 74209 TaxID=1513339 RepID=A0A9P4N070_9PLEO|nr:PIN domain-like protein [Delitschia confertaspora ATCC 74209]